MLFQEHCVGTHLNPVARPCLRSLFALRRPAAFMLVRDETTIATTQAVHLSPQTEHFALQNQADDFILVRG